ncbi:MAG: TIGR04053 family radical SAM/SPASM domain-containing protein [Gemmatimonadetes bacterium]|nr:TIGR04053 family radical SAM/SPASM domain-containing protein [Gemmatimonadota bacterium]
MTETAAGRTPPHPAPSLPSDLDRDPVVIFWELTLACSLTCRHCRAEAQPARHPLELSTPECMRVLDGLAGFGRPPIVVLSGGDPFMRPDLFDIAEYGLGLGLTMSLSPSATALATRARLRRLVELGVSRVSFSLDGASAEKHDAFRGFQGTFARTLACLSDANDVGLSFQINTTVTRQTKDQLPAMADLVAAQGAAVWDLFFLVPTGRASAQDVLSPQEHEEVYRWLMDHARQRPFMAKTTLAQPYRRAVVERRLLAEGRAVADLTQEEVRRYWPGPPTNDGRGVFFISHRGDIFPSGFLPLRTGNARTDDPVEVYRNDPVFKKLRDPAALKGKCGRCPFNGICGGSRARAFTMTGDPLAPDPTCAYRPDTA